MAAHPVKIGDRGLRYLDLNRPGDIELRRFVTHDLHELTLDGAIAYYTAAWPGMTDDQRAYLGCNDRFALMVLICHRHDLIHPWIYARCREVEASPDGHIDLWARFHFKSSIITQGGCLQETLIDPNITIAIFSNTQPGARKFLRQIKETMEQNGLLKRIYSDVLWGNPHKSGHLWSVQEGLVVKRTTTTKEPTISAYSVLKAMPTGSHFKVLLWDDLITERNVTNEEQIRAANDGFELSTALGVGEDTRQQMIGTRYSLADLYGDIISRGIFIPRLYPATKTGKLDGDPILMSKVAWAKIKKQTRRTVAAQMLQNPLMGSENAFDIEWFHHWEVRPTLLNVYILMDPSRGRSKGVRHDSDRTACAVVGVDTQKNKYLLDGCRHRMRLKERWDFLRTMHEKWSQAVGVQYVAVGYERYGMQSDDEVFEEYMEREQYYFDIAELAWPREGLGSKSHRVERLEPDFRDHNFFLPSLIYDEGKGKVCSWKIRNGEISTTPYDEKNPPKLIRAAEVAGQRWRIAKAIRRKNEDGEWYDVTHALMREMLFFPFGKHDDLVDALSRIYDIGWTPPRRPAANAIEKYYADT